MAVPFVNLICYVWMSASGVYMIDLILKTDILFLLSVASVGLFCSFSIVAYCVWLPMVEDCYNERDMISLEMDRLDKEESEEKELFKNKYLEQIESYDLTMECSDEELKEIGKKYVSEKTPMGDVLLYYDVEEEKFIYHAHTSNIPYTYLDTLCRLFVIEHRCVRLYCNIEDDVKEIKEKRDLDRKEKEELEKQESLNENLVEVEPDPEPEAESEPKQNSVFASFKKYNNAQHSGGVSVSKARTEVKVQENDVDVILKERINNYRYGGQILDFKEDENESRKDEKKIDFATFKQMMENKKSV
jgi:hypothetical protein